jgi:bifunctional non-homologous end joining protein LigD
MAGRGRGETVEVGGHRLQLTNLDKVLYPETGTTKADVLGYYAAVAEWMLPHVEGRPATRKRWVNGVEGPVFFEKNLPDSAPDWVSRHEIEHKDHANVYPMVNDLATLTWLAQVAALEVHVPQWRFGPRGARRNPDRLVLDLDPGEGVGLAECVAVARELRPIVEGMGLELVPVTSGSKGVHLYARLDGRQTSEQVSDVAHELARALEADHPDLVLSTMGRADRRGKVLLDWSQNNGNKTTVAPYSLRGRSRPTVAASARVHRGAVAAEAPGRPPRRRVERDPGAAGRARRGLPQHRGGGARPRQPTPRPPREVPLDARPGQDARARAGRGGAARFSGGAALGARHP